MGGEGGHLNGERDSEVCSCRSLCRKLRDAAGGRKGRSESRPRIVMILCADLRRLV